MGAYLFHGRLRSRNSNDENLGDVMKVDFKRFGCVMRCRGRRVVEPHALSGRSPNVHDSHGNRWRRSPLLPTMNGDHRETGVVPIVASKRAGGRS
jgi:hypothetical protein